MKLGYIVALLMIVLMVGCATTTEPAAPAAPAPPAEEPPAAPVAPAAPPEETLPEEAETAEPTDADAEHIERLKGPCERGSIQSCLVLKNSYGIDWPLEVAEEPEELEDAEGTDIEGETVE